MKNVSVTTTDAAWEALLRALPTCGCGQIAEVEHRSVVACLGCAASSPRALGRPLEHAPAALAIVDALSPHIVSGTWEPRK